MSTTLHLTGQVILTDSTGTRLPATDLATALDTVTTSRSGHTPTIAVTDTYNALPVDPATFTVHEDGQLTPAPDTTARPAYTFSYTAFTLTDPTGVASPVQPSALATIGQSAADRLGHEVLVPLVLAMNPRKMAEVLAVMQPDSAERLTVALANRARGVDSPQVAAAAPGLRWSAVASKNQLSPKV